jgi:1-acyl-sn-glycerol-3-phosphate acyltransferase
MSGQPAKHITYPPPFWKGIVPHIVEAFLLGTVRVETGGSEANVPVDDRLLAVFAPHGGWIESIAIDQGFRRAGRPWPAWLTKEENRTLPRILTGGRVLCIDRQTPQPRVMRAVYALLRQPEAALATSMEGTRFGNPIDPEDLRTMAPFKHGPVRVAIRARVPILPIIVLGSERVLPHLDRTWQDRGTLAAFLDIQRLRVHPQPLALRFFPPFRAHLEAVVPRGRRLREKSACYTKALYRFFAEQIRQLDADFPLVQTTAG